MNVQSMVKSHTSTKNAYIKITDLHDDLDNITSRVDYPEEVNFAKAHIMDITDKYKNMGYNVYHIFMGDIYNKSYKNVDKALSSYNFMIALSEMSSGIYSVIGNHETTYHKNNPFWHCVSSVNSEKIKYIKKKGFKVKGSTPIINIVDEIIDGGVRFIFNHHSTGIEKPTKEYTNIGLFHDDILFKSIADDTRHNNRKLWEGTPILLDDSTVLSGYTHCFFGHLHSVYGKWETENDLTLWYLASLGRTNHLEVSDDFLERNIPVSIVEDGKLVRIDDNFITLPSRLECVNESSVESNRVKYERTKERKYIKKYVGLEDNPVRNIKSAFNNPVVDNIIDVILKDGIDPYAEYLEEEIERLINYDFK